MGHSASRPCEATIDLAALRANAALATQLAGNREVIAVVKADAYGHGAAVVAEALLATGIRRLAVLTVPEALELRASGIDGSLLVLAGARSDEEALEATRQRLTTVLHHAESLERMARAAANGADPAPVQVEVDTGMQRMGVAPGEAVAFLERVAADSRLQLEGVFTHLARADEPDLEPSLLQLGRFRALLRTLADRGISPPQIHADNSAALMAGKSLADALPEATAVRPGLMLYGVRPAPHLEGPLQPVMTLRASVLAVRALAAGEPVGYGGSWSAPVEGTTIATVSIGYADGIPWSAANRGCVLVAGALCPIVGRVSMDSIAVDLGRGSEVALGDEVVIFGAGTEGGPKSNGISVEDAARRAGTLHYELLVRVGRRVPRVTRD